MLSRKNAEFFAHKRARQCGVNTFFVRINAHVLPQKRAILSAFRKIGVRKVEKRRSQGGFPPCFPPLFFYFPRKIPFREKSKSKRNGLKADASRSFLRTSSLSRAHLSSGNHLPAISLPKP